jgi:hypothetical protein
VGRSIDIKRYKLRYCLRADCITYTLTDNQCSWNRQVAEYGSYILSSIRVQVVYSGCTCGNNEKTHCPTTKAGDSKMEITRNISDRFVILFKALFFDGMMWDFFRRDEELCLRRAR